MITALITIAVVLVACWLFWRYGTAMMLIGLFIAAARWNSDLTVDDAARNFYDDHDAERGKGRGKRIVKWLLVIAAVVAAALLACGCADYRGWQDYDPTGQGVPKK